MPYELKVPSPGESITQVQVSKWLVEDGSVVETDQEIVEIDSDKATFQLTAPGTGILKIRVQEGESVSVGTLIAVVTPGDNDAIQPTRRVVETRTEVVEPQSQAVSSRISPLAEKMMAEQNLRKEDLPEEFKGKRIGKKEVAAMFPEKAEKSLSSSGIREISRKKLSTLRLKLAERLVAVKNETAMLTTFNEVNMRKLVEIKEKHNEAFKKKYGVSLGYTSFFVKACTLALRDFPQVNSMIEGDELLTPAYTDIGIAVSAPKGLIVPVIRDAELLSLPELELKIKEMSSKALENRITIEDMKGGTFTVTNGGVFGSLMSTPILNPPQSAILGLHKTLERPIAVEGKVEIHPMMYVALSYDHRVIDGRESVGFLVKVKEYIEDPCKMVTEGKDPYLLLLGL